jgi:hypothetical protein
LIETLKRVKFSTFPVSSAMTVSAEASSFGGGALFLPVFGAAGRASDVWRPAAPISDKSTSPSEWTGLEKSPLLKVLFLLKVANFEIKNLSSAE